jgi:hypothetical protein
MPVYLSLFCGGKRKHGEPGTCRRPAGWGTDHVGIGRCKLHGGCTVTHVEAVATQNAIRVARLFGVHRDDIHPVDGLVEELQRCAGLIDSYEAMCAQLLPEDVVFGVLSIEESRTADADGVDLTPVETKTKRGAALNKWVVLLNAERDRFSRLCEAMVKLDLESRRVSIGAGQVAALVQIMLSAELGLSEEQKRAAARLMRKIDSGPASIDGEAVA